MTRCQSEMNFPSHGLGWTAPVPVRCQIETPRLVIRPYRLNEARQINSIINANGDTLLPWMPWARSQHAEVAGTAKYIAEQILAQNAGPAFGSIGVGIYERETGEFLGGTGVHDVRTDTASCEMGYWIRADHRGQGLATEACRHLISWALTDQSAGGLGLRRVRIYCSAANAPSRRIPEKLGLRQEVHQRDDYYIEGLGPTDRLGWGVMADEWDTARHALLSPAGG